MKYDSKKHILKNGSDSSVPITVFSAKYDEKKTGRLNMRYQTGDRVTSKGFNFTNDDGVIPSIHDGDMGTVIESGSEGLFDRYLILWDNGEQGWAYNSDLY